jgi:hypothetical protein
MKLVYTEQALFSLEEVLNFIAPKVSNEKLNDIRDEILDVADTLLLQPFQGQKEPYLEHLNLGHRGIVGGGLAGGLVMQSALGVGGWLAGGQGLSINIGVNFEGIQAFSQMAINSGIVSWEGLGYTHLLEAGSGFLPII